MTTITYIRDAAERKHWEEVRKRLLRPMEEPPYWIDPPPFLDPTWKMATVGDKVWQSAAYVYGRKSGGWPERGGLPDIETYIDPLLWCLKARGVEDFVITLKWDRDTDPEPNEDGDPVSWCRVPLDAEAIIEAIDFLWEVAGEFRVWSWSREIVAFDASEEWAICDTMDEAHLLGGTPEFMRQYFDAAGGEEFVRAWFYHFDIVGPFHYWEPGHPGEHLRNLYKMAGWPIPVYPTREWYHTHHDIDWTPMFGDRIKSCGPALKTYGGW